MTYDDDEDFLEELISDLEKWNPNIRAMVEAEVQRRQAMRARGEDPNGEPDDEQEAQEQPATPHAKA